MMVRSIAIVVPELLPVPPSKGGAVEHWVDEASRRMVMPKRRLSVVLRHAGMAGHEAIIALPETDYLEIKYEEIIENPEIHFSTILKFCGLEWNVRFRNALSRQKIFRSRSRAFESDLTFLSINNYYYRRYSAGEGLSWNA
jgi:hypothetical protein